MMIENKRFFFIANNSIGDTGLSGGDRIYIELARNWRKKANISLVACEEAVIVSKREGLTGVDFYITCPNLKLKNVFLLRAIFANFFKKLTRGILFILRNRKLYQGPCFVYSVSDFYPDSLPAFLVKLINPKAIWIAAFYLFAPAPWQKDSPYKGRDMFRGFLYWLSQRPIYWIVKSCADFVFVTSEPDKKKFITKKRDASKVVVVRGGVNTDASDSFLENGSFITVKERKYDACFIGRFHQQKGVLELVDIWQKVVLTKPMARLAMIGNGPLEQAAKNRAKELGIADRIDFFGFLDGHEKFEVFKQSKIVVHTATFDSGGMAAAEAMAWRLPGVSFDLESLKTYYPKGMVKIASNDLRGFASEICHLLDDRDHYESIASQARDLITNEWDWKKRASDIYNILIQKEAHPEN